MELWAWNQWKRGGIQNRSARMWRIVRVRAGWRQCEPSLAHVHCDRGFLGSCLSWGRERSSFSLLELLQYLPLSSLFLSPSQCFLFSLGWLIPLCCRDTALCHTAHCMVLKGLDCFCCFDQYLTYPAGFLQPLLKMARIVEELGYNHRSTLRSLH